MQSDNGSPRSLHMRNSRVAAAVCIFLVVFGNCVTARAFKLADTGQGKCYQGVSPYAQMPCASTGQDGAYAINPMSFTKNGDGTVTDNNTGLMWLQSNAGNTYNWYQASGTVHPTYNPGPGPLNVCAGLSTGGHPDWRLPSEKELMSIANYGFSNEAFD